MKNTGMLFSLLLLASLSSVSGPVHAANVHKIQLDAYDVPVQTGDNVINVCFIEFTSSTEHEKFGYYASCSDVIKEVRDNWQDVYGGTATIQVTINGVSLSTI